MRILHALLAGVTLALASASASQSPAGSPASPQAPVRIDGQASALAGDGLIRARYMVEAISFKALNETGVDFLGSDEIVGRFAIGGRTMFTGIYGDVDTGETHSFRTGQQCIFPAIDPDQTLNHTWSCNARGAPGPLRFQITLYEYDGPIRHFLTVAGFCLTYAGDDLTNHCDDSTPLESLTIGSGYVELTEAELAALLPTVGMSVENIVPIGSAYRVTIRLTRLRGSLVPPIGEEPPVGPTEPTQPCNPLDPSCP